MKARTVSASGGLAGLVLLLAGTLPAAPPAAPDFAAARDEVVKILVGLVRIDTSNPPGNEAPAAEYIKQILDREGIASEIFESAPGRGNIVARLRGSGSKRPLLLLAHLDVVGVERDQWTQDPFAGEIRQGYIYGRGASDDKAMVAVNLETLLQLHRLKLPLERDVIFLAEAGEEGTPKFGIDFMIANHWDKIACEFALNEGGTIHEEKGKINFVGISTTEKVPRGMRLVARGSSGHGSMPRLDNAIIHLAAAVAKIGEWQPPMRLNDTTRAFFAQIARISPPAQAYLLTHLSDPKVQQKLRQANIAFNSMLRTSVVPTIIQGGFRSNVIPAEAAATLDIRALPDEDIHALRQTLQRLINDPAVEVIGPAESERPVTPPTRRDTQMYRALERAQQRVFPGAVTLPILLTGATDSAQLRAKGVQAYGLGTVAGDIETARIHGNDERVSVEGIGRFLEFEYAAVVDVAAKK